MKIFNLGVPEIIFIIVLALIILGPGNMVKVAKDAGSLIRRITKSPYWKEVWATKRELNELPKMLAKEAQLDETIRDLDRESKSISSSVASTMSEFIKEVEEPIKKSDKDIRNAVNPPETSADTGQAAASPTSPQVKSDSPTAAQTGSKPE